MNGRDGSLHVCWKHLRSVARMLVVLQFLELSILVILVHANELRAHVLTSSQPLSCLRSVGVAMVLTKFLLRVLRL